MQERMRLRTTRLANPRLAGLIRLLMTGDGQTDKTGHQAPGRSAHGSSSSSLARIVVDIGGSFVLREYEAWPVIVVALRSDMIRLRLKCMCEPANSLDQDHACASGPEYKLQSYVITISERKSFWGFAWLLEI